MTDTASLIRELDAKRREAMVAADVDLLGELFSDDLTWIHATARVDTKKDLLSSIGGGTTRYLSIRVEDETVRTFNGTALLSGIAIMEAEIKGERRDLHNRFTIVWSQVDGSWCVVNWQSTSLR
ncbi:nuclear transport factor 2 family protein [Nocardioides sp. KIGAM211]|uniref:Nuclear transport factor 2 family protein n=1 Tax=Nocardioides luti TaxID=2761101 RepID=A0A7X0RGI9_9ACTN|nr:nuclear transport factor 2 family protein [Nocardioides luti]MBB6627797.1 nuclear transport factor 2 family protein [Nocardioides luti]